MKITEYHPFKSAEAKEKYLKLYDDVAMSWPVPSETQMIDTSYGKTFVRISGPLNAPVLVLLHGMGSNSLMWMSNIEELSKNYRTYAIDDIYGNGRSIYTKIINDSNDFVKWLDELFNTLELGDNVNLMGMSYGGWQTSQYVLKFQNRINKIVFLAPAATVLPVSSGFMMRAFLSFLPFRYFTKILMYWVMGDLVKKDEKSAKKMVDGIFLASKCFKSRRPPAPTVLDDDELQSIKVPALYLVGENEKICSAEKALARISSVAPHIKTKLIPKSGHDLLAVQNELVNKIVLEFLSD
jgi:pimeloyl-ACP methyl ester carboxylesterase